MSLFEGRELACDRGGRRVFEGLDFTLEAGGALLLDGPNGSGKSSLLRLMAGLLAPSEGELLWQQRPARADEQRSRVQFLGHLDAVKPVLSARENLEYWTGLRGGTGEVGAEPVDRALDLFGLAAQADVPGRLLSAGQKRRLALARLLTAPAGLWLLDEPGVGLDRDSLERLGRAVAGHREGGGCVVAATHMALPFGPAETLSLDRFAPRRAVEFLW